MEICLFLAADSGSKQEPKVMLIRPIALILKQKFSWNLLAVARLGRNEWIFYSAAIMKEVYDISFVSCGGQVMPAQMSIWRLSKVPNACLIYSVVSAA